MIYSKLKALECMVKPISPILSLWGFLRRSRAANPKVQGLICLNFETIQAFMVDLVTCKNEEDPIQNGGARVATRLSIIFKTLKGS